MRKSLLVGIALTIATVAVVLVNGSLDLDVEPVALLGLTIGAVIALSYDRSTVGRIAAFGAGVAFALLGYALRALVLPDSAAGLAVSLTVTLMLITLVSSLSNGRAPLWAGMLGAGAFAGAYERVYTAAPAELLSTGIETLSVLLLAVTAGFLAGTISRPSAPAPAVATAESTALSGNVPSQSRDQRRADREVELDDLLAS